MSNDFPYAHYIGVTMDDRPIIPVKEVPTEPATPPCIPSEEEP